MGRLAEHYRKIFVLLEFSPAGGAHDARLGHGYGRAGKPTGSGSTYQSRETYPYGEGPTELDPDVESEDVFDEEDEDAFLRKTGAYISRDANAGRGNVDRASFVQGGRGLGESLGMSPSSISTVPNLYKGRKASGGAGGVAWTVYKTAPGKSGGGGKGTKKGWASSPPVMFGDEQTPAYTLDDIPLNDDRVLLKIQDDHADLAKEFQDDFTAPDDEDDDDKSCECFH